MKGLEHLSSSPRKCVIQPYLRRARRFVKLLLPHIGRSQQVHEQAGSLRQRRAAGHIKDRSERRQFASPARPPLNPAIILYLLPFHHDLADRASKASHLYLSTPLSLKFGETPSREPAGHFLARPVPSTCTALFTLDTR